MSENAIELQNVYKSFFLNYQEKTTVYESLTNILKKYPLQKFNALTNVSFTVKKGEMLGIIGHNGSGKSTLLKIICRIISPDSGIVKTDGKIVSFLQLGSGMNGDLTAIENIRMYGMILGMSKKKIEAKILEILEYSGLQNFKDVKVKNFSSGMFTRLAFSIAIQSEPEILVLDEVLSVGDLEFDRKSHDTLLEYKKNGTTIVWVTHNIDEVEKICDKAILMYKGYVGDRGDPKIIVDKYKTIVNSSPNFHQEHISLEIDKYYNDIMGRKADIIGLLEHIYKIKKGKITLSDIPEILKNSPEYVEKITKKDSGQ